MFWGGKENVRLEILILEMPTCFGGAKRMLG